MALRYNPWFLSFGHQYLFRILLLLLMIAVIVQQRLLLL